jgi:hypothetical protein
MTDREKNIRRVGVAQHVTGLWHVVADNPFETVWEAGEFETEREAWKWVRANCERLRIH